MVRFVFCVALVTATHAQTIPSRPTCDGDGQERFMQLAVTAPTVSQTPNARLLTDDPSNSGRAGFSCGSLRTLRFPSGCCGWCFLASSLASSRVAKVVADT